MLGSKTEANTSCSVPKEVWESKGEQEDQLPEIRILLASLKNLSVLGGHSE